LRAFEFKPKKKKIEFDRLPVKPTGIPAKPAGKPVGSQMHWDLTGLPEPECSGLGYPVGKKKTLVLCGNKFYFITQKYCQLSKWT